jgi:tRNA-dihydrouridine synthase
METLLDHTNTFMEDWGETKHFAILRKFYKIYASGFDGASDLRVKLMETQNEKEVKKVVSDFLNSRDTMPQI